MVVSHKSLLPPHLGTQNSTHRRSHGMIRRYGEAIEQDDIANHPQLRVQIGWDRSRKPSDQNH